MDGGLKRLSGSWREEDGLNKMSELKRLVQAPFRCGRQVSRKENSAPGSCGAEASYVLQHKTKSGEVEEMFICMDCAIGGLLSENEDLRKQMAELEEQLKVVREAQEEAVKYPEQGSALSEPDLPADHPLSEPIVAFRRDVEDEDEGERVYDRVYDPTPSVSRSSAKLDRLKCKEVLTPPAGWEKR